MQRDDGFPGEAIAGLLAVLGIGAVGYAAMRSRRRREAVEMDEYDASLENEAALAPDDEMLEQAPRTAPVFGMPRPAASASDVHYDFGQTGAAASGADAAVTDCAPVMEPPIAAQREPAQAAAMLPTNGAAMTAEERSRIIDRMVDADPDEANPFVSRKSRRKRARLLLQKYEADQRQDAPFDWRTYRPTTKPSTPASPPLVTA